MSARHGTATVTLPSDTEILIERHFAASPATLWRAITEPALLLRWWGPDWCPMVDCRVDLRVGGDWRYVCRDVHGNEFGWHGRYLEVESGERIVSTEVFEGFPDAESVNTMTLHGTLDGTWLRTLVRHSSREHRDGHLQSGMESGMQVTFDRLDDLVVGFDTVEGRYRRIADGFGAVVAQVADEEWDRPAPCDGWVARDVVGHLVEWVPSFFAAAGLSWSGAPDWHAAPAVAWRWLDGCLTDALADPVIASREFDAGPPGRLTVERAVDMVVTGDVLVHTWDLATAVGRSVVLDPGMVAAMFDGMQAYDQALRSSGHYGPRVPVPADADPQTRLIAFTGRTP